MAMARTRIKVCCIANAGEVALAVAEGADALGFVGPMPTGPGPIDGELIRELVHAAPTPVARFLLTSETTGDGMARHLASAGADTLQVVIHVEPEAHRRLAELRPDVRRVQVIHVEDASCLGLIEAYAPLVHAFLLDSGRPALAELGGTGRTHDWSISRQFVERSPRPVFLAGGLRPDNVGDAIRTVRPYGVDLCTGIRTDGALDPAKLRAFVAAVHAA